MKEGYYINQQSQLVVVTPQKTISVWSEQDEKWIDFFVVSFKDLSFNWEYLGEL